MRCGGAVIETTDMVPRLEYEIKDLRQHSPETLETLRALLAGGAGVHADPKRPHFYELEGDTHVFYVYVSPVDGAVELLATWPRAGETELMDRRH